MDPNILFVCSMARFRSKTAHDLFNGRNGAVTRYCGTDPDADIPVTQELIDWAVVIVCMEKHHRNRLKKFDVGTKRIEVLDIRDEYDYMDEWLVRMLKHRIPRVLGMTL